MRPADDAAAAHLRHASAVASAARAASSRGDHMQAMLATLEVLPDQELGRTVPVSSAAAAALREAWLGNRERHVLRGHEGTVKFAFFTPDMLRVVSVGNDDGTVRAWRLDQLFPEGMVVVSFPRVGEYAEHSPDGRWLYVRDEAKRAWLYDFAREPAVSHPANGHASGVYWAMFSPDSRWMVTHGGAPRVILWQLDTGPPTPICLDLPDKVHSVAIEFSADGRHLLAQSAEQSLHLFDLNDTRKSACVLGPAGSAISRARFSADGSSLITLSVGTESQPAELRRWTLWHDPPRSDLLTTVEADSSKWILSPSGRYFVKITDEGIADLQDLGTTPVPAPQVLHGHFGPVRNVVFSRTETLASFGHNGTTCVWTCNDLEVAGFARDHAGPVLCASFAPDPEEGDPRFHAVATAGADGVICLYGADGGGTMNWTKGIGPYDRAEDLRFLAVDTDPARLVLADYDGPGRSPVWSGDFVMAYPLRGLAKLRAHEARVHHVAFSADGQWLVSASADGTARIWDARPTFERQATSNQNTGYSDRIALTAAGEATGPSVRSDLDCVLWLREPGEGPRTEACLGRFPPLMFNDFGERVELDPSEFTLQSHAHTLPNVGSVYWWSGSPDFWGRQGEVWFTPTLKLLIQLAKAALTRTLTASERTAFGLWPASDPET